MGKAAKVVARHYDIKAAWGSRPQSPEEIGAQWLKAHDAISRIGPRFAGWRLADSESDRLISIDEARPQMAQIVEAGVWPGDWDRPDPDEGYSVRSTTAQGGDEPTMGPRDFESRSKLGSKWNNYTWLTMGGLGWAGDLSAIRYPEMKALVWAVASSWGAPWVNSGVQDSGLGPFEEMAKDPFFASPNGPQRRPYGRPWVGYLSAERAAGLVTPASLVSERTPDGGILISATTEQFDLENAEQLEQSLLLSEIMLERGGNPGI